MNNRIIRKLVLLVFSLFTLCAVEAAGQAHLVACGDERDTIIAEYATYGVSWTPGCDDFSQTAHSDHFAFAELNSGDYSWAIVKASLTIPETSSYGLERWRKEYGSSRIINSAYRNPKHNSDVGGAKDSRHMYGDATDLRNESRTEDEWSNMQAAATRAQADYIEPRNGPCDIGCVHADWRNTTEQNAQGKASAIENVQIDIRQLSRTTNAEDRAKTFEDFVRKTNGGQSKRSYDGMAKRIPADASRTLIELLANENAFVKSSQSKHASLSETYTDYYADLIGTVSAFHDPASIPALLESAPTGWIAIRGIAQFGATALTPTSAMLRDGDIPHRRAAAQVLKTILSSGKLSADENANVTPTIKAALDDKDGFTRYGALESVAELGRDDFPAKLRFLKQNDTFQLGNEYPIRKLAAQILKDWGLITGSPSTFNIQIRDDQGKTNQLNIVVDETSRSGSFRLGSREVIFSNAEKITETISSPNVTGFEGEVSLLLDDFHVSVEAGGDHLKITDVGSHFGNDKSFTVDPNEGSKLLNWIKGLALPVAH